MLIPLPIHLFSPQKYFKDFICLIFREGEEGEREGEKHQCVVASRAPPKGARPTTQACALDQEWNLCPFDSQASTR